MSSKPSLPPPPPIPANWPSDAKWVWHSKKKEYVKGIPQFNYMPNIDNWLNKKAANRKLAGRLAAAQKERDKEEEDRLLEQEAQRRLYPRWGDYLEGNAPPPPPRIIPSNWPEGAKWVWNPIKKEYVKGLPQFDYAYNIQKYLRNQKATRRRSRSRSHSRGPSRSHTRGRSGSRR